jgi:ABC-type multidrug transport system ATPase subunit
VFRVRGLDKGVTFRDVYKYVVHGATFETDEKGAYVLLGPNGSGKTTILRLAAGVLKPEKGIVLVGGRDPYRDHFAKGRITYVSNTVLADTFETCGSYLSFYLQTTPRDMKGDLKEAVSYFGLEGMLGQPVFKLSAGQRKRLELSKLLLRKAPYIFVDEPTANLDSDGRRKAIELIKRLSGSSLVLLATHELDTVDELEADVIVVKDGVVENIYSYEQYVKLSDKLQGGYLLVAKVSWKPKAGNPRDFLKKYGSKVEIRRLEVDATALLRSMGIDLSGLEESPSVSVVWIDVDSSEIPAGAVFKAPEGLTMPVNLELVVFDRATVSKLVEDLMDKGEVEDLRITRVAG